MKTTPKFILLLSILAFILAACSSAPADPPTSTPVPPTKEPTQEPSATPVPPTDTPVPTALPPTDTPAPTLTPLPEGVLFRDDFEGSLQPGWDWENENPERWSFTDDGWLQIIGEHDSLLGDQNQKNLLWYPLPGGNFQITVHLKTIPFENFHQSTIYIYEDSENYIALNRGYCDICGTGGGGFYMEYKISGDWGAYQIKTDAEDVYLRLISENNMLSGFYAETPDQWERLGRFGNYFIFKKVGIGVSNVGAGEDLVGQFDFFEIAVP